MRSLFIIATCIAAAIVLLLVVFPWLVASLAQAVAAMLIVALIAYAGAEAWPYLHRYLQKRRIME